jgi:hypothetical protein
MSIKTSRSLVAKIFRRAWPTRPSERGERRAFQRPEFVRLLFDEQLSEELVKTVGDLFPDSLHIRLMDVGGAADPTVWQLAREAPLCAGDQRRGLSSPEHALRGAAEDIARLLRDRAKDILRFEAQSEETFLELR